MMIGSLAFAIALPGLVAAQEQQSAQAQARPPVGPPIQRIATASHLSTEQIGNIQGVRELPDGRVLVNDGARRRLLIMDSTMKTVEVVLDSLSEIANTYGTRAGMLIPYRADSTLFVDPASLSVVILDSNGKLARVRSVWRAEHVGYFTNLGGSFGWPGVDAKGRVVYRIPARAAPPKVAPPPGVPWVPQEPDSAFIVAMDLDTRKADTLAYIRIPRFEMRPRRTAEGFYSFDVVQNPLPATDEWAILPDGTVALVRWRDYRIDYLNPDGTKTSSQKLPYDWIRMTDADKERLVDSVKTIAQRNALNNYVSQMIRWVNLYGKAYPDSFKVPENYVPQPGFARDWILPPDVKFPPNYIYACAPGQEPPANLAAMGPAMGEMMARGALTIVTQGGGGATVTMTAPPPPPGGAPVTQPPGGANTMCLPAPVNFGGGTPPPPQYRAPLIIDPLELPDFRPPIPTGSVRADLDGNLWIRTNPPRPGGAVYDVVSRQGELVARYQMPPGYTIQGFGRGKVVYASMRDAQGIHLARIRLK